MVPTIGVVEVMCRYMGYTDLFACLLTVNPPISQKATGMNKRVYLSTKQYTHLFNYHYTTSAHPQVSTG